MTQKKVTFDDKINRIPPGIDREEKIIAEDVNELKTIVNDNSDDAETRLGNLETGENSVRKNLDAIARISSTFDDTQTIGNPGTGLFRLNGTEDALFISYTQNQGSNIKSVLETLNFESILKIQSSDNKFRIFKVTGLITDNITWAVIPISILDSGDAFVDGDLCGFDVYGDELINRDASGNQLGYKYIPSDFDFTNIPAGYENSIWEIRYEHDLGGANVILPSNVTLKFEGGLITNYGVVTGNNTIIKTKTIAFDTSGTFNGTWNNSFVVPEWFGSVGDGIVDDTLSLINCHSLKCRVEYNSNKNYIVKNANVIEVFDGVRYNGNGATITVPSDALKPDTGDGFGRFNNNVFYRNSTIALSASIFVENFNVKILSTSYNFVGGGVISPSDRDSNIGYFYVRANYLKNAGIPPGQGGISSSIFNSGALTQFSGYSVNITGNIIEDCGNGIVAFNSYFCEVVGNIINFSGVSRDFTSWSNVAAILVRGSYDINVNSNLIYVTGGSSIFVSIGDPDVNVITKSVLVKNNTLQGCGLSGISGGIRTSVVSQKTIESIDISGNSIFGWLSGIEAPTHSAIKIAAEDGNNSLLKSVNCDNYIDYLAPWESFNYTTNEVDNSYNVNKTKGNDPGNQYGVIISADSANGVINAVLRGEVLNHQRLGFGLLNVKIGIVDVKAENCGWSRDLSDNAFQTAQSLDFDSCENLNIKANVNNQSRGVNFNNSFCTPIKLEDIQNCTLYASINESGNQTKAVRLVNSIAGYKLRIDKLEFDNPILNGGFKEFIDDSSGANTRNTILEWKNTNTSMIDGSRNLPPGNSSVGMRYTSLSARTVTLYSASYYKNSTIRFSADTAQLTITPNGTDTIDGVNSSIVLALGQTKILHSDGVEWFSILI